MAPYKSRASLPSSWETRVSAARSQAALSLVKIEGLKVKYVGPGEDDTQAVTIRANLPVPSDLPLYYFEVEILNKGAEGFIGVGFQTEEVLLARLPGWEPHSYGYHGDDGCVFSGSGRGRTFGPPFTTGDVVGALWHRADRTISFFKNGVHLGVAFTEVPESRYFPCIGLRTRGEEVIANFGNSTFKTDVAGIMASYQQQVLASVRQVQLPLLSSRGSALLPQLIHDYLMHHRCCQTAAIVCRDLLSAGQPSCSQKAAMEDVALRQQVYELVCGGRVEEACRLVTEAYSSRVLEAHPRLDFRLRVQGFVERVGAEGGSPEEALAYGRSVLAPWGPKTQEDEDLFADALSLLAYEQPSTSPSGHLLQNPWRTALAEELNGAILAYHGQPAASPLERLYQQTCVVLDELKRGNDPASQVVDVRELVHMPAQVQPAQIP